MLMWDALLRYSAHNKLCQPDDASFRMASSATVYRKIVDRIVRDANKHAAQVHGSIRKVGDKMG